MPPTQPHPAISHLLGSVLQDVAELCVQLLSQPAAADTTFEVKSTVPFSEPWTGGWSVCLRRSTAVRVPGPHKQAGAVPAALMLGVSSCSLAFAVDPANPPPPRDWGALLEGANLKQRVTGRTIEGRYLGKEPEPLPQSSVSSKSTAAV